MREGNAIRYGDQKSRNCKMQILQTLSANMLISNYYFENHLYTFRPEM